MMASRDTDNAMGKAEHEGERTDGTDIQMTGTRQRVLTEKGHEYMVDRKTKEMKDLFSQIKRKYLNMETLKTEESISALRQQHSQWLTLCEEFLKLHEEFCRYVDPGDENPFDDKLNLIQMYKKTINSWFVQPSPPRSVITPEDSASQIPRRQTSRTGVASRASSVSSAKLREEQRHVELSAKLQALDLKRDLELAKLDIKLKEEELTLKTEMSITEAKTKLLNQYETTSNVKSNTSLKKSQSISQDDMGERVQAKVDKNQHVNSTPLRPTAESFVPHQTVHSKFVSDNFETQSNYRDKLPTGTSTRGQHSDEQAILGMLKQMRKPVPNIKSFSGDPLTYRQFMRQFKSKVVLNTEDDDERLNYLEQFTQGEAHKIVMGFSYLDASVGYSAAMAELQRRYGDPEVVANAFIKRALEWPIIKADSPKGLDEFSIFLEECNNAVHTIEAALVLQYPDNLRKLVGKLPYYFHDKWRAIVQNVKHNGGTVTFQHLTDFVKSEANKACDPTYGREALRGDQKPSTAKHQSGKVSTLKKGAFATNTTDSNTTQSEPTDVKGQPPQSKKTKCMYCGGSSHDIETCYSLGKHTYADRIEFLKSKGVCFGCLHSGHLNKDCRNRATCYTCKGRHPSSLHDNSKVKRRPDVLKEDTCKSEDTSNKHNVSVNHVNNTCGHTGAGDGDCTMAVIPVRVKLKNNLSSVVTYAFLDPGSNVSFCSSQLLHRLGGNGRKTSINIDTLGVSQKLETYAVKGIQICDLHDENQIDLPQVYTKDKIPISKQHIPTRRDIASWPHLKDVNLPEVNTDIGLLIGNNIPDAYTPIQIRTGPRGSPHATQSLLGWIVWNVMRDNQEHNASLSVNHMEVSAINENEQLKVLDRLVRDSINLEFPERQIDDVRQNSQEDKRFVQKVESSIQLRNNHYVIGLPFKHDNVTMPDNQNQALNRLENLKRKLLKDASLQQDYTAFMNDMLSKGYAEKIHDDDLRGTPGRIWYIPHHGVYHHRKPDKLRVVFDCSATHLGTSLNNVLLQGPDMTNTLLGVLLRFRQESIAIMGDIEAMFYQVHVPESDRDFLRFLWWPDGNLSREPEVYRMTVHIFGATSSPSCSSFALRRTADDNSSTFNETVTAGVMKSFYVDDYLSSTETVEEASALIQNTSEMCLKGGFKLTKWTSNSHSVLESVDPEHRSKETKLLDLKQDKLPSERALGVYWMADSDKLSFKIGQRSVPCTRRGILSLTSSIYDPLGFLAPFNLVSKSILQELCRQKCGWDEPVRGPNETKWTKWVDDLDLVVNMEVNRCYKPQNFGTVTSSELHHFADASDNGYGMVTYLRLSNESGQVHCSFVMGKARVAPLKTITIPRMELTAATILVRMNKMLLEELDYKIDQSYFWTDSMTVLRYIANEDARFRTFVANRIAIIREATQIGQWMFVGTASNPADCASRGLRMDKLLQTKQWIHGPDFLWQSPDKWPSQPKLDSNDCSLDEEIKPEVNAALESKLHPLDQATEYHSDWPKLRKTIGWLLHARQNLQRQAASSKALKADIMQRNITLEQKQKLLISEIAHKKKAKMTHWKDGFKESLSLKLFKQAERALVKHDQEKYFAAELEVLQSDSQKINKTSSLLKLDPFLMDGIIRVGGRLQHAALPLESKHPIVLPKDSPISKKILESAHKSVGHLGKNTILSQTRKTYWIIGASTVIKSILSKCTTCRRYQAPSQTQKMASLPQERVVADDPPFSRVALDYYGPFETKRARTTVKRYGVIFTCLSTRAVHLEMAATLDTDSCVNAIRRFVARRGPVRYIRSDNGTNLVGAKRELKEAISNLNSQQIQSSLLAQDIQWEFNPPSASHFGGVWERLIRIVRKVLYSILHSQTIRLDDEGLNTLFCEVEAIINGRPITETPCSPNDFDVLTPNHLLCMRGGEQVPPGTFDATDTYYRRRWRQIQFLADLFWKRWTKEYLPLLQQRQKWQHPQKNLSVGDLVLIMDSSPRNSWSLARILETYEDKKGLVRVVKLKTRSTTLLRPVGKLCLILESESENDYP